MKKKLKNMTEILMAASFLLFAWLFSRDAIQNYFDGDDNDFLGFN